MKDNPRSDAERLLLDCDDLHFAALSRLADEAAERGDQVWADGWRWLATARRWPIEVCDAANVVMDDEPVAGPCWQWWRLHIGRAYNCSLPKLLLDHVRRAAKTPRGMTCSFATPGAALACAAFCAGNLIKLFGSVDEPGETKPLWKKDT